MFVTESCVRFLNSCMLFEMCSVFFLAPKEKYPTIFRIRKLTLILAGLYKVIGFKLIKINF